MLRQQCHLLLRAAGFVDSVKVLLASGAGGDGVSIMAHEHGNEFAGPGGGNGGNGGNVMARCVPNYFDLRHIQAMGTPLAAEAGRSGYARQAHGKRGKDLWLPLPVGCQITDVDTNEVLFDLDEPGTEVLLLEGGQGGKGNAAFANKWHHSPIESTRGLPGNTLLAQLELKLIADCGLIGFPNAGKSSLLAAVTTSKPSIAAYAFTTLRPYVGVLQDVYGNTCRIADLPGLIDGAYENRGLGHQFLRHVERSKSVAYVVDMVETYQPDGEALEPWEAVERLRCELEYYSPQLSERAVMIFANKMDVERDPKGVRLTEKLTALQRRFPTLPCFPVSAALGIALGGPDHPQTGLTPALDFLAKRVFALKRREEQWRQQEREEERKELQKLFELKHNGLFRSPSSTRGPPPPSAATTGSWREEDRSAQMEEVEGAGSSDSLVDQQLDFYGDSGLRREEVELQDGYRDSIGQRRLHEYRDWTMRGRPWSQSTDSRK